MPSFLKKIFRRGSKKHRLADKDESNEIVGSPIKNLTRKQVKALAKQKKQERLCAVSPVKAAVASSAAPSPLSPSSSSSSVYKKRQVGPGPASHTLVDLDDSSFADTDTENVRPDNENGVNEDLSRRRHQAAAASSPSLSHQRLREHHRSFPPVGDGRVLQLTRLDNGRLTLSGDHAPPHDGERAESPTSTDFCLSTDVEDEAYNELRRRGGGLPSRDDDDEAIAEDEWFGDDARAWTPSPVGESKDGGDREGDGRFCFEEFDASAVEGFGGGGAGHQPFESAGDATNNENGERDFPDDPFDPSPPSTTKSSASEVVPPVEKDSNVPFDEAENPFKKKTIAPTTTTATTTAAPTTTPTKDLFPDSSDSEFESNSEKRPLAGENVLLTTDSGSVTDKSKGRTSDTFEDRVAQESRTSPTSEIVALAGSPSSRPATEIITPAASSSSRPTTPSSIGHHRPRTATFSTDQPSTVVPVSPLSNTPDERRRRRSRRRNKDDDSSDSERDWLFDEMQGTLGPAGVAPDLESLGERSRRSRTSHTSRRSRTSRSGHRRQRSSDSVGSRHSHLSGRSHRSALSHMSDASRSVAKDLLRLEMQLAMVDGGSVASSSVSRARRRHGDDAERSVSSSGRHRASRRNRHTVVAPPGKLGIILANKSDVLKGTVVSGVRASSVLADRVFPGDRIVAIDGEDVSRMTVSEITTIMARKTEFERTLTIMTTPMSGGARSDSGASH